MRLPRDLTGPQLMAFLRHYGYEATRQTGSHIRLTTTLNGEHHITVPNHDPLRIGTLNSVLTDVAEHIGVAKTEIVARLLAE